MVTPGFQRAMLRGAPSFQELERKATKSRSHQWSRSSPKYSAECGRGGCGGVGHEAEDTGCVAVDSGEELTRATDRSDSTAPRAARRVRTQPL